MGKRYGRKITRKVKMAAKQEAGNGCECKAQSMYIDSSVCEVYQVRHPERCFGCRNFRG